MNKNLINNYRMGGYLLVALGLINLRYQSGNGSILSHSLLIVVPGALVIGATWISSFVRILELRATKALTLCLGLALVAYAILN